ncbi:MAG: TIGR02099 family protein [Candidatus Accumulibacter sp.]|nr:TIGR02099 family protein [Accumulibacter sp.]
MRAALHRRCGFLSPSIAGRLARVFAWSVCGLYFLFILLVLSLRYAVLPNVENYRPLIERIVADSIGLKVDIGRIEADWDGIHPELTLYDVSVADVEGRPALAFLRVDTVLSWWSVVEMRPCLRLLRIDEPTLHMRRGGDGRFFIAGIPLFRGDEGNERNERNERKGGKGGISSWVFEQRHIRIGGATLVWEDELRGAPALVMEEVNIAIDNDGRHHRFGLTALPPDGFASRIDLRGDFRGSDFGAPGKWRGQAFAEVDYADLAVWKRWVDYPLALTRGRGAARVWLSFAGGGLREVTADMALRGVDLRFAEKLPALSLESLSGRLRVNFLDDGFILDGRELALSSRAARAGGGEEAIRIDPADFEIEWRQNRESGATVGKAGISRLDLGALARLAAYLPFDAQSRQLLEDYAPRGEVSAFLARWSGSAEKLSEYSLEAGVRDLGLRAKGYFPGFSGITGALEASETGGKAVLRSGESSIDLPAVFPESLIRLDSLNAQVAWKIDGDALEVELARVDFAGPEAAGSAQGKYRATGDGPGIVDLSAALTRAEARAVWRYLPYAVGRGARHWLRDSLLAGKATEAHLVLKGNLKDFPFTDKDTGRFLVTVKARDAVLDYGAGWPRIDDIQGELRFEGKGMTIEARQGRILGARLSATQARIPDFDAPVSTLLVKGQAEGPTAEFLKFIEQSPVGEQIGHFTEGLRAAGNGHLELDLTLPLDEKKFHEAKVAGVYRFIANEMSFDDALPPLRRIDGQLRFSGSDLVVPGIDAVLFGGPLKIRGGLRKDGRVLITADGVADIGELRRQSAHPALAGLSGKTPYRGEIRIRGRNADLLLESNLVGLASTLPEPFAKAAADALPLRFETRLLPAARWDAAVRDQLSASLGMRLTARIVRRKTPGGFTPERGAIAIGRSLNMPEKGLTLDVTARRLDLDVWQKLFGAVSSGEPDEDALAWRPDALSLRAGELVARGMSWNDIELSAAVDRQQWQVRVDSRQAAGELVWDGADGGRLAARLGRLAIERLPEQSATDAAKPASRPPALDVVADDFSVRRINFGRLEVRANNDGAAWNLERIQASNPHGMLTGKGSWRQDGGGGLTQLDFKLDSGDVGGLLARLGYPGSVRAGTAQLEGKLAWNGAPTEIDFASMNGHLRLKAAKGQFLKLDPGAAGKLLGLISLQNLPRRISLDFKDVFSEGLAFNAVSGRMAVQKGVMRTDRLRIDSPVARVLMRGEVDLARETQRLEVTVRPELGDTAAVGVAMVHPAAGVATWLASKVLKNPLGTVFSYHYLITGAWDDPKVEKQAAPASGDDDPSGGANEPDAH